MTISVQNSSDDSHLAASIEPATTASMVGTNSKAVMCMSDVQTSSRSHFCLSARTWGLVRGGSAHFAAFVQEYSLEQYSIAKQYVRMRSGIPCPAAFLLCALLRHMRLLTHISHTSILRRDVDPQPFWPNLPKAHWPGIYFSHELEAETRTALV